MNVDSLARNTLGTQFIIFRLIEICNHASSNRRTSVLSRCGHAREHSKCILNQYHCDRQDRFGSNLNFETGGFDRFIHDSWTVATTRTHQNKASSDERVDLATKKTFFPLFFSSSWNYERDGKSHKTAQFSVRYITRRTRLCCSFNTTSPS